MLNILIKGFITLLSGTMFAGKSKKIVFTFEESSKPYHGNQFSIAFKPRRDTRSTEGLIEDHDKKVHIKAFTLPDDDPWECLSIINREENLRGVAQADNIFFDEAQFFTGGFAELIMHLKRLGYHVYVGGLTYNFRGQPFGDILTIAGFADEWEKLKTTCAVCRAPAHFTQRFVGPNKLPAPYDDDEVRVGGEESYEPRCMMCIVWPGKLYPPDKT